MFHGFINLNKPLGWTSHDCVARSRRLLNTKKVGHGGTLDPLATGVLPIAVGRATKLLQYLPEQKAYRATIRFGLTTTTDDLEGETVTQQSAEQLTKERVETALLANFLGTLQQKPPMYSAVQVQGKRLYDLARQGRSADIPARTVTIHQLRVQDWSAGKQPELIVDVDCGPGTYIRSLARDLGEVVGTGATLAGLCRTHSSGFELSESVTLETLEASLAQGDFVPISAGKAMSHMEAIALSAPFARRWCLGQKLLLTDVMAADAMPAIDPSQPVLFRRVLAADTSAFLGIGEIRMGQTMPNSQMLDGTLSNSAASQAPEAVIVSKILAPKRVFATV
ncbi:MAG: tRNA pseudouridine(55) synthase TruB [Cyanobacteria bacterium J06632_22]